MNDTNVAVQPAEDWAWQQRWDLRHRLYVTHRYHRRREGLFDRLEKITTAGSVLLGATILSQAVESLVPIAASLIAGLGFLSFIFGYSNRRVLHSELASRAMALVGEIEGTSADQVAPKHIARWSEGMAAINALEPPALKTLVMLCEHEQAAQEGHPDQKPMPPWYRRLVADFC